MIVIGLVTRTDIRKVLRLLQRCQKALALTKQASQISNAQWVKLRPYPYDTLFRHTSPMRSLIRLLYAEATIRIQEGDANRAIENCIVLLRIARHFWDEPFEIHAYHASLIFRKTGYILQHLCENNYITPDRACKLLKLVSSWNGDQTPIRLFQLKSYAHPKF